MPLIWQYVSHKINEISSLGSADYIKLVATYYVMSRGPTIDPEIYKRGYAPEVLATLERELESKFEPIETMGLRFTRPPEKLNYLNMPYVLTLFSQYELGNLPFPGSVSEQPAQVIEIFKTLAALRHEHTEEQRKANGG